MAPKYTLHDLPPQVWSRFRERAMREQWTLPGLFHQLMADYGEGRISPTVAAPARPPAGFFPKDCPNGHHVTISLRKIDVPTVLAASQVPCPVCGGTLSLDPQERDTLAAWALTADSQPGALPPPRETT